MMYRFAFPLLAIAVAGGCSGRDATGPVQKGTTASALSASTSIAADREQSRLLYATVPPATGAATQLVAANVDAMRVTVIGSTGFPFSAALAFCPSEGKDGQVVTYTMINTFDPTAQLAKLDLRTGVATKVGSPRGQGLNIMGMTCSPDGTLYAIGQSNTPNSNFNSLYTVDRETGFASRIGSTGVNDPTQGFSGFLMALAFAPDGTLYAVNTGTLFRVNRLTGVATKSVDLVAVRTVMGLAIDEDGKFYVADWVTGSRIYTVDLATGMATPILNTGLDYVHNIAFKPDREGNREHLAVVAIIRGRGTAEMTEPGLITGKTVFFAGPKGIKLLADGSATGHFTCIDVVGLSTGPGNINGEATSWSMEGDVVVVNFVGTLSPIPGGPQFPPQDNVPFTVKIQKFGGAAVGHWTMQIGDVVYCVETLTSGKIAIVYRKDDDSDD